MLLTLLFLGGMGMGVWATHNFLLERPLPEQRFEPRAQVASLTKEDQKLDSSILDPKAYLQKPSVYNQLTDAILINGGAQAESNYFSHHLHIRMIHELLTRRGLPTQRIQIFSSDGEDDSPDQVVSSPLPKEWLWRDLPEWQILDSTQIINTTLSGARLLPARKRNLRRGLRNLASQVKRRKKPSTVLLFVTDHGTKGHGPWGNKIELWKQQLTVAELRGMLQPLGSQTRVISVMSQCYSGGFANLLYRKNWKVHGNRCGFFSTVANREAYGCFPETAKKHRVGHAYRMIRAMRQARTLREAHRSILLHDLTPDVPVSTSDIYLEDMLRRKFRKLKPWTQGVDRILQGVWQNPHRSLKSEISLLRRMEKVFYLPRYQTLAHVWRDIRRFRHNMKEFKQIDSVWRQAWKEVQRGSLMGYYQSHPQMAQKIEFELNRPDIDEKTKRLGKTLYRSYLSYLQQNKPVQKRLFRLYKRYEDVQKKIHLMHTHEAALLRVAKRLTRIAGLAYLRKSGKRRHKRNFEKLMRCESTPIGGQKVQGVLRAEGVRQDSNKPRKLARIKTASLLPAWLGIGFQAAPQGWYPRFERLAPGSVQVTEVVQGSPAETAGLRLGDIVIAVGGKMLKAVNEIRDLVMLSSPNKPTFFLVYRGNKMVTLKVQLRPLQRTQIAMAPQNPHGDQAPPDSDAPQPPQLPGFRDDHDHDTRVYGLNRRAHRNRPSRRTAPQGVSLTSLDGQPVQFPAKKGATLAFFWATWCEGCKAMAPMLRKIQARYKRAGLTLLAITSDSPSLLRPFLRQWGTRWPFRVAIERNNVLSRRFRISTIPQLMVFKPDGSVALHIRMFGGGSRQQLEATLRRLLRR